MTGEASEERRGPPKQVNKVIQRMSGTSDGGGEGTGEGGGNEPKAKDERERKAEIRKRLIETTGEGRDGAGRQKPKQLPAIPCFCPCASLQHPWETAEGVSGPRSCRQIGPVPFADLIIDRMLAWMSYTTP